MVFTEFNFKPKTFRNLAIIFGLIGAIFVLASNYIGYFAIRLLVFPVGAFFTLNLISGFKYFGLLKKITYLIIFAGLLIIFLYPALVVKIAGFAWLFFSAMQIFSVINQKRFGNKFKIGGLIISVIAAIFIILYSDDTIDIVIRLIGTIFLILACFCLYQFIDKSKSGQTHVDHVFEHDESESVIIDVEEIKDIEN